MKKYIKPSIEVIQINPVTLLQASALNDSTADGNESLSRAFDFSEDYDFDE